jgi:hypothetical protein
MLRGTDPERSMSLCGQIANGDSRHDYIPSN